MAVNTFSDSRFPDILINNAGAGYFTKIDELSLERWHEMINTNLNGAFSTLHHPLRRLSFKF